MNQRTDPMTEVAGIVSVVFDLALVVEPDRSQVKRWYSQVPIAEFGHATARQLVENGQSVLVVAFLARVVKSHFQEGKVLPPKGAPKTSAARMVFRQEASGREGTHERFIDEFKNC